MARAQKIKIINILLASLDGKIATHDCESSEARRALRFTNADDFKYLQNITAQCDAVFIGAKSIECEIGAFRVAHLKNNAQEPHWYVFTQSGNINFKHAFWSQENIPKSVFHYQSVDHLNDFLNSLLEQKIQTIALLGGGKLNSLFWQNHLVDELHLTLCPMIIANKNAPSFINSELQMNQSLKLLNTEIKKDFLFLHYKVMNHDK